MGKISVVLGLDLEKYAKMYLQALVLGLLAAIVCAEFVPYYYYPRRYWMRHKRNSSPTSSHRINKYVDNGEFFKRKYYNPYEEDLETSSGVPIDVNEVKIFPSNRRMTVYEDPSYKSNPDSSFTISPYVAEKTPVGTQPASNPISSSGGGDMKTSESSKRRVFISPHGEPGDQQFSGKDSYGSPTVSIGKSHSYSQHSLPYEHEEEHHGPAKYEFKYSVHDLEHYDVKSHQEERDGEHTTGEYSVLQPDGTILTVKYTVHGDEGFNAIVQKADLSKDYDKSL